MSVVCRADDDGDEPERNAKGQWIPGVSGNPAGRPPKPIVPPKSWVQLIASEFGQLVTIKKGNGSVEKIAYLQAFIKQLMAEMTQSPPEKKINFLQAMCKLGVFQAHLEMEMAKFEAEEEAMEDEVRRLIELFREDIAGESAIEKGLDSLGQSLADGHI